MQAPFNRLEDQGLPSNASRFVPNINAQDGFTGSILSPIRVATTTDNQMEGNQQTNTSMDSLIAEITKDWSPSPTLADPQKEPKGHAAMRHFGNQPILAGNSNRTRTLSTGVQTDVTSLVSRFD